MNKQSPLTIGKLAKQANVGVETIRFYQRKGILLQPPKLNGFRHYSDDDVKRVRLVKKLQKIGFSLEEIKEFLIDDTCCSETKAVVRRKTQDKMVEIQQTIAELNSALAALEKFSASCGVDHSKLTTCELLSCFENEWTCCEPTDTNKKTESGENHG